MRINLTTPSHQIQIRILHYRFPATTRLPHFFYKSVQQKFSISTSWLISKWNLLCCFVKTWWRGSGEMDEKFNLIDKTKFAPQNKKKINIVYLTVRLTPPPSLTLSTCSVKIHLSCTLLSLPLWAFALNLQFSLFTRPNCHSFIS